MWNLTAALGIGVKRKKWAFRKKDKAVLEMPVYELNCCFTAKILVYLHQSVTHMRETSVSITQF